MLKILVLLGSVAFIAIIPALILAFIHLKAFNRCIKLNHPDIGKISVFAPDARPAINSDCLALGKKARNGLIATLGLFGLFLLCGLASSLFLPG